MASFPLLKTGAVAQYGSERARRFSTRVARFIDGKEQRSPQYGGALKRWVIRLERLDEAELAALEKFFESQAGRAGSFEFTDPWDAVVHADCSFESDAMAAEFRGIARGAGEVAIRENR